MINVGHNHPKVVEAIKAQVDHVIHPGFNVIMYENYVELAEKLCEVTPGTHDKQVILLNSGAEAVENAVKIARRYTKKSGVVSFTRGYHGRTNLTMGMTSKVKPYKEGFGPFAPVSRRTSRWEMRPLRCPWNRVSRSCRPAAAVH